MENSLFEYSSVMISVILGVGLAELLSSVGSLIRNIKNIVNVFKSPLLIWVLLSFISIVQMWWGNWIYQKSYDNIWIYFIALLVSSLHYLIARLVLPDFSSYDVVKEFKSVESNGVNAKGYNLRGYYIRNVKKISLVVIFVIILSQTHEYLIVRNLGFLECSEAFIPGFFLRFVVRSILLSLVLLVIIVDLGNIKKIRVRFIKRNAEIIHYCSVIIFLFFFLFFIYKNTSGPIPIIMQNWDIKKCVTTDDVPINNTLSGNDYLKVYEYYLNN
ncbi:hypothetical protein [Rhodocaloribacter sp.]